MLPKLYIIVPCYNEEEVLPVTAPLFLGKIRELIEKGKIAESSRVLFVNDVRSVLSGRGVPQLLVIR